jgi:3-deoxy-7-phosphoheptulonate synthase
MVSFHGLAWNPASWRKRPAKQLPDYPNQERVNTVVDVLKQSDVLIPPAEVRQLKSKLGEVAAGRAIVLQGGDCAELFSGAGSTKPEDLKHLMRRLAFVTGLLASKPVVTIGRIAGQFAKPRSEPLERRAGLELPSYRGDIINGRDFSPASREHTPEHMLTAYLCARDAIGQIKDPEDSQSYDLQHAFSMIQSGLDGLPPSKQVIDMLGKVKSSIDLLETVGIATLRVAGPLWPKLYASHEALLLPYEEALTRRASDGLWYNCGAHTVWIGERTRQLDGAHVEYARGIQNPVGIKCGPTMTGDDLIRLLDVIDPRNEPGRICLVIRAGVNEIERALPRLCRAVTRSGRQVVWLTDPMHGNTISVNGYKTRRFEDITKEVLRFFEVSYAEGVYPGGLHIEMAGDSVTEIIGASCAITEERLPERYLTACDPRLNPMQAFELIAHVGEILRKDQPMLTHDPDEIAVGAEEVQ